MRKLITLLLITTLAINACGPTMESENESWKNNLAAMDRLKTEFPVYATLIDQKLDEANKAWDEAQGISNEDQKLEKMVAANNFLDAGTIGNLRNMKNKISSLKSKKESLMKLKTPDYKMEERAQNAFDAVDKAIKKADKVLYMTPDEFDINEAPGTIDKAWTALNDAYKEVEIIIDNINKANKAITDEKAKTEQAVKDEKQKTEEAHKDVKCEYCGTLNTYDYSKCKSCGAPRSK